MNYSTTGFTYEDHEALMDGVDVSHQFDYEDKGGSIFLNCSSIDPANGTLSIGMRFTANAVVGNYSFDWRYIYVAYQQPPNMPGMKDVTGSTSIEVIFGMEVPFYAGWNLIGVPMSPRDPSVEGVFAGNLSKVEYVYGFDNALKEYSYWIAGVGGTLTTMQPGEGYWAYCEPN